jgi:hypothetical protein
MRNARNPIKPAHNNGAAATLSELLGKMKTKTGVGDGEFRVTSVYGITGKNGHAGKDFRDRTGKICIGRRSSQPRYANSITRAKRFHRAANLLDPADDFVAGN